MSWRGWAIALVVGAAASMSTLVHLSGYGRFNWAVLVVFLMLMAGFAVVARRMLLPLLSRRAGRPARLGAYALVALLAAVSVQLVWPFQTRFFPRSDELEVTALAQRNPLSQGSEVWAGVSRADGAAVAPNRSRLEGGWEQKDEHTLMNAGAQLSTARWAVKRGVGAQLKLTRHPWSGMAKVRWQGTERVLDLYAAPGTGPFVLDLVTPSQLSARDRFLKWFSLASDTLVLTLAWYLLIGWIMGRRAPPDELQCG